MENFVFFKSKKKKILMVPYACPTVSLVRHKIIFPIYLITTKN